MDKSKSRGGKKVAEEPQPGPSRRRVGTFRGGSTARLEDPYEDLDASEINETVIPCPYDKLHKIPAFKMNLHLMKCRQVYRRRKIENKETIVTLTCKWNHYHQVEAPELLYHESGCPDRKKIYDYQLRVVELFDKSKFDVPPSMKDLPLDEKQLKDMVAGLYINTFIGSECFGTAIPFDEIGKDPEKYIFRSCAPDPDAEQVRPREEEAGAAGTSSSTVSEDTEASSTVTVTQKSASTKVEDELDSDDEEYWNKSSGRPVFNLMESLCNPSKPMLQYPPGLSKSQRREFVKWNRQWMENIQKNTQAYLENQSEAAPPAPTDAERRDNEPTDGFVQPTEPNPLYPRDKAKFSTESEDTEDSESDSEAC